MKHQEANDKLRDAATALKEEAASLVERLRERRVKEILDRPVDPAIQDLTRLAAIACQTPIAQVSLIDNEHQWLPVVHGPSTVAAMSAREHALCNVAIQTPANLLVIEDARHDPRFSGNPWVTSGAIGSYVGAPLVTEDGAALGTLCVIDKEPRTLSPVQQDMLLTLARVVARMLSRKG